MPVKVNIDGIEVTVKDTDDPVIARKAATRFVKKQKGDYSALGESLQGVRRGSENIAHGITELVAMGLDAVMKTDLTDDVDKFFQKYKTPRPISKIGQTTEFLTQFGVPAHLATKAVRKNLLKKELRKKIKESTVKGKGFTMRPSPRGEMLFGKLPDPKKLSYFKHTVAPIALADFVVAGQETPDLGVADYLDRKLFNDSESDEDVIRSLDNKISLRDRLLKRIGVATEGAGIMLGVPQIWKHGIKPTFAGTASVLSRQKSVMTAADWLKQNRESFSKYLNEAQFKTDPKSKAINKLRSNLQFRGYRPAEVAEARARQTADTGRQMNEVNINLRNIEKAMIWYNKKGGITDNTYKRIEADLRTALFDPNKKLRNEAFQRIKKYDKGLEKAGKTTLGYLEDGTKVEAPKHNLFLNVKNARKQIDSLSGELEKFPEFLKKGWLEAVDANKQSYGYTAYKAFIKGERFFPDPKQLDNVVNELIRNKVATNRKDAEQVLQQLFKQGARTDNAFMIPEYATQGLRRGLLKDKSLGNLPELRKYLGEVTGDNLPDLLLKTRITVDNLTRMTSGMRYLDEVARIDKRIPLRGIGSENKFLYDSLDDIPKERLKAFINPETGIPYRIGDGLPENELKFGALNGKIATKEIRDAVTGASDAWGWKAGSGMSQAWGAFLYSKGLVQQFKTIYSPITQVRNLTSASLFPIMNGNLVAGQTLQDSVLIVLDAVARKNRGERARYYRRGEEYGIINTGQQRDTDVLFDEAKEIMGGKWISGENILNKMNTRENNFFTRLYQGSDDVWKIVSWEMEQGRLNRAFRNAEDVYYEAISQGKSPGRLPSISRSDFTKMTLKNKDLLEKAARVAYKRNPLKNKKGAEITWDKLSQARREKLILEGWSPLGKMKGGRTLQNEIVADIGAGIVRDTVPNYAKVGNFIKALRRTPFGNFIAFPAEIVRTSTNSASRAIDEIASGLPELAEIGMRRLMGNMAVMYGIPKATVEFGKYMTGADDEQILAFKRSFANPWEKNADLVPIRTDKNGNIVEFYNYSYTNPYEYLRTPFRAIFNAVANGEKRGDKLHEIFRQALLFGSRDEPGALREWLEPFFGTSIAGEAIRDIASNTTYTRGRRDEVWNKADDWNTTVQKMLLHIVNVAAPPVVPWKFRGTEPILKDLPRATLVSLGLSDKPVTSKGGRADIYKQLAESFTGLKTIHPTIERTLGFRATEANQDIRYAATIYGRAAQDPNILDPEEHVKALLGTNEIRFSAIRDLSMAIEDAKTLGLTDSKIFKILKSKKVANPKAVMQRLFIPYFPTEYQIKAALDKDPAAGVPYFPEAELRQSWAQQIKPTLPKASFTGPTPAFLPEGFSLDPRGFPMRTKRLSAQQKAAIDPRGSAAVLLRQKELEKLLGIR